MSILSSCALVVAAVYFCIFEDHTTNVVQPIYDTVKLGQCGPFVGSYPKQDSTKVINNSSSTVEDLEIAHAELGFAASDLVEFAKHLEKVVLSEKTKRAEQKKSQIATPLCNNFTFPSFPSTSFGNFTLPYMPEPNLTELNVSALGHTLIGSFNATEVYGKVLNTTKNWSNATHNVTKKVGKCVADNMTVLGSLVSEQAEMVYEDVFQTELGEALRQEYEKRMAGPKGGVLRFSVNDAVQQMGGIFRTCHSPKNSQNEAVLRKFSKSTFSEVAAAKVIMTTTVADGFLLEARTVAGLWTNVKLTRDSQSSDFTLELKRDKIGLIHTFVNGIEMGEI